MSDINDQLTGQGLVWGIWDREGVVAAATRDLLQQVLDGQPVRARMWRSDSPQHLEQLAHTHRLGLAVWVLLDESELPSLCQALVAIRDRHRDTICVCYLKAPQAAWCSLLVEAGAQVMVSDLPSLQRALPRIVARTPLSPQGYHPLTSGLMERLPWGT